VSSEPTTKWEPLKWEYVTVPAGDGLRRKLQGLGEDGWELVAIAGDTGKRFAYFKRPMGE
jgi:hypothetical protein